MIRQYICTTFSWHENGDTPNSPSASRETGLRNGRKSVWDRSIGLGSRATSKGRGPGIGGCIPTYSILDGGHKWPGLSSILSPWVTKARELRDAMAKYVPTDAAFEQAFATARVSRPHLARYYLRALEKSLKADEQPEYVANEEVTEINLEHVLPLNATDEWGVSSDEAKAAQKMLGNMVLLRANQNRDVGNKSFQEKKPIYGASGYFITQQVAKVGQWGQKEIRERQAELAKTAVKTWPLTFGD